MALQLKRKAIHLDPEFQRRDALRQVRKSRLIESLVLGLPIPQIVLAERKQKRGPVTREEWITLLIREQDESVHTVRGQIRVPTVIVAVNYAKVPKKRPKLCAKAIRERDGKRCQYTGRVLHPNEGSLDHVVPRSRGGMDAWENLVWSAKEVNQKKADRLPHEAGLKLLSVPRAPKELPVSALIRNTSEVEDWRLFLNA